jgi:hypothetical protein
MAKGCSKCDNGFILPHDDYRSLRNKLISILAAMEGSATMADGSDNMSDEEGLSFFKAIAEEERAKRDG